MYYLPMPERLITCQACGHKFRTTCHVAKYCESCRSARNRRLRTEANKAAALVTPEGQLTFVTPEGQHDHEI